MLLIAENEEKSSFGTNGTIRLHGKARIFKLFLWFHLFQNLTLPQNDGHAVATFSQPVASTSSDSRFVMVHSLFKKRRTTYVSELGFYNIIDENQI